MATSVPISWSRIALEALVAGVAGAVLIDGYLWLTTLAPSHTSILVLWAYIATTVAGKSIAANPNAPWIGLAVHAATSIAWAGAYAYVAATQPFVARRWVVSGLVYGLIVYMLMQIVLLVSGNFEYPHTPNDFVNALIAHAVFFGLPVALIVNRLDRE